MKETAMNERSFSDPTYSPWQSDRPTQTAEDAPKPASPVDLSKEQSLSGLATELKTLLRDDQVRRSKQAREAL